MLTVAQTNLQLYRQLISQERHQVEIAQVRAAYNIACELFSGLYRPSGKTFIAHLVGTASVLADCYVDINVVNAGLVHAAYTAGDFGDGKSGLMDFKRTELASIIGSDAEKIVFEYSQQPWPPANISEFRLMAESDNAATRNSVLIRLANELEEYVDLGVHFCHEEARRRIMQDEATQNILIEMADIMSQKELSANLSAAFNEPVPDGIQALSATQDIQVRSTQIPPRTYRKVMQLLVSRLNDSEASDPNIYKDQQG
jgi:(p)ppGpp synthase/HD superfamily hydrolase